MIPVYRFILVKHEKYHGIETAIAAKIIQKFIRYFQIPLRGVHLFMDILVSINLIECKRVNNVFVENLVICHDAPVIIDRLVPGKPEILMGA